jgi:hypothetical protein
MMVGLYRKYEYYYSGEVLEKLADPKRPEESPLQYPLQINLCREWADMMASYVYGQWDQHVITHLVDRKQQQDGSIADLEDERCESMERVLREQWEEGDNDSHADMAAVDMMVYGGFVVKTHWDMTDKKIKDEWLCPDVFIPRWHPTDVNRLLEVIIAYNIARQDAMDVWNIDPVRGKKLPEEVLVWERWTPKNYQHYVEDIPVRGSEVNPHGFIPYIYIPRRRSSAAHFGYYGISCLENTMALQDEVNERAADIGDGIAYSSHPIRVIVNYAGKEDLTIGPDSVWDLGYGFGGREPKAFTLETTGNYTQAMEYVRQVESMGRNVGHLPPVAFGEDEGSQRSGTTLLIRFLPLTQEIKRTRLYLATGLRQRAMNILKLAAAQLPVRFTEADLNRSVKVQLAPILPKDISDKINEWAVRIPAGFGTPEQAYEDLGHPRPKEAAKEALEYQKGVAKMEAKSGPNAVGGTQARSVSGPNSGKTEKSGGSSSGSGSSPKSGSSKG